MHKKTQSESFTVLYTILELQGNLFLSYVQWHTTTDMFEQQYVASTRLLSVIIQ